MLRVPAVSGPLPNTPTSYPFSTMARTVGGIDLDDYGYLEEEYFVSGTACIYDNPCGQLAVTGDPVRYTNRILVRRPKNASGASGIVWVDILNASNGYDLEDHWRRAWDHWMAAGHTYVGVTSKPVNVDGLKTFDPERYHTLTWDTVPGRPLVSRIRNHDEPFLVIPGAEEGLVWDILTQTGVLLRDMAGRAVVGGVTPRRVFLSGHSQSAVVLNTYIAHFHDRLRTERGAPLWDGYLCTVGTTLQRPLQQVEMPLGAGFASVRASGSPVDVPTITITSEGDLHLFDTYGHDWLATPGLADGPWRRHYCVAGSIHGSPLSPVAPLAAEIRKSGRLITSLSRPTRAVFNVFPLEVTITASMDAIERWVEQGVPAPESVYFDVDADNQALRDELGNIRGGLRYGLLHHPLGRFDGAKAVFTPLPKDEALIRYPSLTDYLSYIGEHDETLFRQGYLNNRGSQQLADAAAELWSRL